MPKCESQRIAARRATGVRVIAACGVPGQALAADGFAAAAPVLIGVLGLALLVALGAALHQRRAHARARARIADLEQRVAEQASALTESGVRLDELHDLLKDISLRDGLTGVYNRRCLDQVLLEAWKTTTAQREPLSLLMIDIDRFKQLNDRYGHGHGDECLREVAQRLQRHTTTLGGMVARYGGEEFVVVLAHTGTEMAQALAEALRNAVAGTPIKTSVAPLWVSISLGVATSKPGGKDTLGAVLKRADEAMYRAKHDGRNRVVVG